MVFIPALILVALVCVAFWLYPAFQFLRGYEQRLKELADAGKPPSVQREEVRLATVQVHIYRPQKNRGSMLLVVPGLHPDGIHDKRFTTFAESCAEAGFLVIAPDILEFRQFRITGQSLTILRSVLDALPKLIPPEERKRTGILGISYGAGPAFLMAAERKLDYVVSIGGYYNLLHALEYSFTGAHEGQHKRKTHEWGRLIFAFHHVKELASASDSAILERSLALRLKLEEAEAETMEKRLSPDGKELVHGILNGLSDQQTNRFRTLLQIRKSDALALSPESTLSHITPDTRIYLIHGTTDDSIPYEETLELKNAFEKAGMAPRWLLTPALAHVDVKSVSGLWESVKLLNWQRHLLREASAR